MMHWKKLKHNDILEKGDHMSVVMEVFLFNNSHGKMENVVKLNLPRTWVILVIFVAMFTYNRLI